MLSFSVTKLRYVIRLQDTLLPQNPSQGENPINPALLSFKTEFQHEIGRRKSNEDTSPLEHATAFWMEVMLPGDRSSSFLLLK